MKLGKLNSAIRGCKQVSVPLVFPNGTMGSVLVQKTDLIKQLQEAYDKQRAEETGLDLKDGALTWPQDTAPVRLEPAEVDSLLGGDDDDLLGGPVPSPVIDHDDLL